jgi:Bacteriophage HK97-gp10, putative tail-component
MPQDFTGFAKRMTGLSKTVEKQANAVTQGVATELLQQLVVETPIDTGKAKSNWLVGVTVNPTEVLEPRVPGEKGSTSQSTIAATIEEGKARIALRKTNQDIYIANNVDYIGSLNNGTSKQAPSNFVQKSVYLAADSLKKAKVLE